MPKDPTKNVDRYKVRGGVINEYEYHQNQEALAHSEPRGDGKLIPGTPPEEKGEGLQPGVAATATKANQAAKTSKPQKSTKSTKTKKPAKPIKSATTSKATKTFKGAKSSKASKAAKSSNASESTKAAKAAKNTTSKTIRGATAKKLAARKAAKK